MPLSEVQRLGWRGRRCRWTCLPARHPRQYHYAGTKCLCWHLDPDWTEGRHERGHGRCATSHRNFYASPLPTDGHCICLLLDPAAPVMQKAPSQPLSILPPRRPLLRFLPLIRPYATGVVVLKVRTLVVSLQFRRHNLFCIGASIQL